ncbi:DMT family transporter [Chitinimonas arctica]|uniref:DMT family transporter n=1 Tax=Chitinimonas arctica TaxID=2594795 RepID=A0A516SJE9_9NEIS|nr:DMT family transporter [Chitinimonas arctica]QDQ28168.1 DMT family transporter [Chitinimonas arctica]
MVSRSAHWWNNGRILALLAAACFSMKAIFVKLAYAAAPVDPISLLALRMGISLPAFIWLAWWAGGPPLPRGDWLGMAGLGLMGYYLSSLFDFLGLQYISAGLERLILFTYPTLVLLMEALVRRKLPNPRVWAAMALCYLGLLAAFWHDLRQVGDSTVWLGSGLVMLSSLCFACYYMGTGRYVGRVGSSRLTGLSGAMACGFVLGQFMLTRSPAILLDLPSSVWVLAGATALFSTVLPIWLAARAVERLGPSQAAAIGTIAPALTIVFGWIILHEAFSLLQLAGLVLVVAGVVALGKLK